MVHITSKQEVEVMRYIPETQTIEVLTGNEHEHPVRVKISEYQIVIGQNSG